jgi:PAS domain S-box-containing protein
MRIGREITEALASIAEGDRSPGEALGYVRSIVETVREPLLFLDADLRLLSANDSFYNCFRLSPEEEGKCIYELGNRQWDIPRLREFFEKILPGVESHKDFEIQVDLGDLGHRWLVLNARRIPAGRENAGLIVLALEDVTELKRAEEKLRESERELEIRSQIADIFLSKMDDDTYGEVLQTVLETLRSKYQAADISAHMGRWNRPPGAETSGEVRDSRQ